MTKRILIVDDSVLMRATIRSALSNQTGIEVCGEAADGIEGIEKAVELKPDLILLDFFMPRMSGVEVATVLKLRLPHVPLILFTMYDNFVGRTLAERVGILILSKSGGLRTLLEEINDLLFPAPPPLSPVITDKKVPESAHPQDDGAGHAKR